jgi:hypothetical protein
MHELHDEKRFSDAAKQSCLFSQDKREEEIDRLDAGFERAFACEGFPERRRFA